MMSNEETKLGSRRGRRGLFVFGLLLLIAYCSPVAADASGAWTRQRAGTMAWLRAVFFLDAERGWAAGGNGVVLATTDGGAHWTTLKRPTEDALRDIFFLDATTGWLVCDRSIHQIQSESEPRSYLLQTRDGGQTWKRFDVARDDARLRLTRVLFTSRERGWTFGEAGALYTTYDGGQTWSRQLVPSGHLLLGGAFLDAQQGWLVGAGATALYTTDGGERWRAGQLETRQTATQTPSPALGVTVTSTVNTKPWLSARLRAVSFVGARRGWAVGSEGRIFSTVDGGRTWSEQASSTRADLYDVKFLDEREGWAAGEGGTMLHTEDGGANWVGVSSGTTLVLERLAFAGSRRGWAVGFGGTILSYAPAGDAATPRLKRSE